MVCEVARARTRNRLSDLNKILQGGRYRRRNYLRLRGLRVAGGQIYPSPLTLIVAITTFSHCACVTSDQRNLTLEIWANAQRDGRPVEYRWRPLFNAAVWLMPTTTVPCSNAAKTQNPLKFAGVPQTNETISTACGP